MPIERKEITGEMLNIINKFKLGDWYYREGYEDMGFSICLSAIGRMTDLSDDKREIVKDILYPQQ